MILDKFLPPFIDFIDENFGRNNHKYVFITSEKYAYGLTPEHQVEFLHTDDDIFIKLLSYMKEARKIILHGLWRDKVNQVLSENIEILEKSYWIMWGGDYITYDKLGYGNINNSNFESENKKIVISKIKYLLTYIPGSVELARKWYGATGKHIECISYLSNTFKAKPILEKANSETINILVGNSSTITNNHIEILTKIKNNFNENLNIYCPLSYGCKNYAKKVINHGSNLFGDKFTPLLEFMNIDDYLRFLNSIDIAFFNHNRHQGMGNIINLLGLGKVVFLNKSLKTWSFFYSKKIKIYNINNIGNLTLYNIIKEHPSLKNKEIIEENFSINKLKKQWEYIFSI